VRKPDQSIFVTACKRLMVHPAHCIFLDDIPVNLKAAKGLGIDGIKVRTSTVSLSALPCQFFCYLFLL
jgi:putative hydrolase of the HAD superfamily